MDLEDYWSGKLSFRDLLDYTSGLELGSRSSETWSQLEHLVADLVDTNNHMSFTNMILAKSWCSDDKVFRNPPDLLIRPGFEPLDDEPVFSSDEQIATLFGGPIFTT